MGSTYIPMAKGCGRDNVCVERLWKSMKYEDVCLRAYDVVSHAKAINTIGARTQPPGFDVSRSIQAPSRSTSSGR